MSTWKIEAFLVHGNGEEIDWITENPGLLMRKWLDSRYKNMTMYQDLRVRLTHRPSGMSRIKSIDKVGKVYRIKVGGRTQTIEEGIKNLKKEIREVFETQSYLTQKFQEKRTDA